MALGEQPQNGSLGVPNCPSGPSGIQLLELCVEAVPFLQNDAPLRQQLVKRKQELKVAAQARTKNEEEEDGEGGISDPQPYGLDFRTLHRNFVTWRQMPQGWKRRLIDYVNDIALGIQATKVLIPRGSKEPKSFW